MSERDDGRAGLRRGADGKPAAAGGGSVLKRLEAITGKPIRASRRAGGNVFLLVDCSGSMADGDKLGQAGSGAKGFAEEALRQGYRVGLIRFASAAEQAHQLGSDHGELAAKLDRLTAYGSTDLAAALALGRRQLAERPRPLALCVVTDGMPDDVGAAIEEADRAKTAGIDILTIGTDDADTVFLEQIASAANLARKVEPDQLAAAITSTARLLPGGPETR